MEWTTSLCEMLKKRFLISPVISRCLFVFPHLRKCVNANVNRNWNRNTLWNRGFPIKWAKINHRKWDEKLSLSWYAGNSSMWRLSNDRKMGSSRWVYLSKNNSNIGRSLCSRISSSAREITAYLFRKCLLLNPHHHGRGLTAKFQIQSKKASKQLGKPPAHSNFLS